MDRADDERLLHMLALWRAGRSVSQIARKTGMTYPQVRSRINTIIDADCRHDPEALKYWRSK